MAAQWMGWENVFQVEWDEWCRKVLAKNFPETKRYGDIKEFNELLRDEKNATYNNSEFRGTRGEIKSREQPRHRESIKGCISESTKVFSKQVDILTGGFPCQPFSHAGKRKGTDDSRYLWPEMLTTIRILKPSFVVGENVAGLISMENGKTLDGILSDLANEGYTTEQFIIPACGVGAWHRRDRIWIVAYSVNDTDRTKRGTEGEAESISGKCGETGCTRVFSRASTNDANTDNQGLQRGKETGDTGSSRKERNEQSKRYGESLGGEYWQSEPSVGRVANGIPSRVDRLKGLGNAIVPQVAYEI